MKVKREVKLALTAIAAVVILIWGINFLKAKALFDRNNVFYGIYDRVDGLKVSSSVIYRGYSVGQVSAIQFTGERYDKVLVQFTVGKKLQISSNTIADGFESHQPHPRRCNDLCPERGYLENGIGIGYHGTTEQTIGTLEEESRDGNGLLGYGIDGFAGDF